MITVSKTSSFSYIKEKLTQTNKEKFYAVLYGSFLLMTTYNLYSFLLKIISIEKSNLKLETFIQPIENILFSGFVSIVLAIIYSLLTSKNKASLIFLLSLFLEVWEISAFMRFVFFVLPKISSFHKALLILLSITCLFAFSKGKNYVFKQVKYKTQKSKNHSSWFFSERKSLRI